MRVPMVLQGDTHPRVEHDEDHSREEGVLLRVQAQNHGNDMINKECRAQSYKTFRRLFKCQTLLF